MAAPLAQCKKVTLVTSGKGDVGAAKLTGEVFEIMERLPKMVEGMTGVDLNKVRICPSLSTPVTPSTQPYRSLYPPLSSPLSTSIALSIRPCQYMSIISIGEREREREREIYKM